jgi:adenylosuccinate synthase
VPAIVVVGLQFGDEGKGKIVDYLAEKADAVVRFNGGSGAGHTVVINNNTFKLHLIPCGVFRKKKLFIGNGVVVDPEVLIEEIKKLEDSGLNVNLMISERAHVTFDFHRFFDAIEENFRGSDKKVGTTKKGIGPTYSDKAARFGIRVIDLTEEDILKERLKQLYLIRSKIAESVFNSKLNSSFDDVFRKYLEYGKLLKKYIGDVSLEVNKLLEEGKLVLFEGAQGTLLDLDHGIYPLVTSSTTISGGASVGTGISPLKINEIIGVVKAITTRIGETGPFPTEMGTYENAKEDMEFIKSGGNLEERIRSLREKILSKSASEDEIGSYLRLFGQEFGATTGRPRRCGWLDMVALKYAIRINGVTGLAITKLDILSGINPIKICIKYNYRGKEIDNFPASMKVLEECRPVYEEIPGWEFLDKEKWEEIASKGFDALPEEAKYFIKKIEELTNVKVKIVSVGAERNSTIEVGKINV